MSLKTFDPKAVIITLTASVLGSITVSGYAEDSFLKIARAEDTFTGVVGADGKDYTRSKSNNKSGTIAFTVQQSSDTNQYLSQLQAIDEASGTGTFTVMVTDLNYNEIYASNDCFFSKPPDTDKGKASGDREWTIVCPDLAMEILGALSQLSEIV
jgi:hypothetical protein